MARGGHGVLCHGGPVHRGGGLWLPGGVHPVAGDFGRPARPLAPADHRPAVAGEYAAHVPGPGGDFGHLLPGPPGGGGGHPVGGPAGGDRRRPAGGLRRGGPGPGLGGAALITAWSSPWPACSAACAGTAGRDGRPWSTCWPAPWQCCGAGTAAATWACPWRRWWGPSSSWCFPPPAPGGIRAPMPAQNPDWEAGRQALSRKVEEMARGLPHPLRRREGDPPSRGSKHGKPGGDLHPGRRQGVRPVRPGDTCWQKEYQDTRAALNDATQPMLARGRALATDFSGPSATGASTSRSFGGGEPPAHGLPAAAAGVAADL